MKCLLFLLPLSSISTLLCHAFSSPKLTQSTLSAKLQAAQQLEISSNNQDLNNIILFDGVCNFCNTWVDILLRLDTSQKFKFAPLQSSIGQQLLVSIGKEADDISSVILIKKTESLAGSSSSTHSNSPSTTPKIEFYDKSRCVLKVVEELGPLAKFASEAALVVVPEKLRDSVYDTVAENRYNLMGKRSTCRCSDPQFADRFLLDNQ